MATNLINFLENSGLLKLESWSSQALRTSIAVLGALGDGVVILGEDLNIRYANHILKDRYGDLKGLPVHEILDCCEENNEACKLDRVLGEKRILAQSYHNKRGRHLEVVSLPLGLSKNSRGVLQIIRDITEEVNNRKLLRSRERHFQEASLERSLILDNTAVGIAYIKERMIQRVNPQFCDIFGYDEAELLGVATRKLYPDRDSYESFGERAYKILQGKKVYREELLLTHKDGSILQCFVSGKLVNQNDLAEGSIWVIENISSRKAAEKKLALLSQAIAKSPVSFLVTDRQNRIISANHAFTDITGYELDEVLGKTPGILSSGRHDGEFYQKLWRELHRNGYWQGEIWNRRKNGELYPEHLTISSIKDENNDVINYVAAFSDITRNKAAEEVIKFQANYDALTGLPNRTLYEDRLTRAIIHAEQTGTKILVLIIDLDNFKWVNDSLGHPLGDQLLMEAALRISSCMTEHDTVARMGGDEFMVMLPGIGTILDAEKMAHKILRTLSLPYQVAKQRLNLTASIGVALYPENGENPEELLKSADLAMYSSKEQGRATFSFFDTRMNQRAQARVLLETELLSAIEQNEFCLVYQPVVDLNTGRTVHLEALLRWQKPGEGVRGPDSFISLAEETGLINPIGAWVINEACRQIHAWEEEGLEIGLAINISARQHGNGALLDLLRDVLEVHQVPADRLSLEITEGLFLEESEVVKDLITGIRDMGLRLAIDDFGTGYASFNYLKRFIVEYLKIDRSFIQNLPEKTEDRVMVQAILAMADELGIKVIAEGVELSEHIEFLRERHCGFGQGYFFSKPLPAPEISVLFQETGGVFPLA